MTTKNQALKGRTPGQCRILLTTIFYTIDVTKASVYRKKSELGGEIMGIDIKIRLLKLGRTQRWLLMKLHENGYATLSEPRLSSIINGSYTSGYSPQILELCNQFLKEEEAK